MGAKTSVAFIILFSVDKKNTIVIVSFCPLVKGEEALIVTDFRDTSATEVRALYVNCSAYLCTFLQQSLSSSSKVGCIQTTL